MSKTLTIILDDISVYMERAINDMIDPVAKAATKAVYTAGRNTQARGRHAIGASGLTTKWENALRLRVYPVGKDSVNPAAFIYHKIPFAGVFETGATIHGNPLLWLPLATTPKTGIGKGHTTPKLLQSKGIHLFTINRSGKPPLLAADIPAFNPHARRKERMSLYKVRAALLGKKSAQGKAVRAVPLFIGKPSITIPKKFDIAAITASERDRLGQYYVVNLNALG